MTRRARLAVGGLAPLTLALVLLTVRVALAHATLESAIPALGSSVRHVPARVTARFSQDVDPDGSQLLVAAPDGGVADTGDGGADLHDPDRRSLAVTLKAGLPGGVYTVSWITKSAADGDTQSGTYTFTVDPNAPETGAASPTARATAPNVEAAPTGLATDLVVANPPATGSLGRGAFILGGLALVVAVVAAFGGWRRRRRRP